MNVSKVVFMRVPNKDNDALIIKSKMQAGRYSGEMKTYVVPTQNWIEKKNLK